LPQYSHLSSTSCFDASGGNDSQHPLQSNSQTPLLHSPVSGMQQTPVSHGSGQHLESEGHGNDSPMLHGSLYVIQAACLPAAVV